MQTKEPRSDTKRVSVLKEAGFIEIHKLEQDVTLIAERNKAKYLQILWHDPNYNVLFYEPNDMLKTQKAFKKQLLLKQLDKLMDQQTIFDKKLAQLHFIKQVESQNQTNSLSKELNPYQALRTAWAKHEKTALEAKNCSDRLESLNWTIGMIKNTVISMKQKQEQLTPLLLSEAQPVSSKNFEKLTLQLNRSLKENQQLKQEISFLNEKIQAQDQIQRELEQKMEEKQKQIKNFKKFKEMNDVDHKFALAQLEQELFLVTKKVQKLQKWKFTIQKNSIENGQKQFRLYFDIFDQSLNIEDKFCIKSTSKSFSDILEYLMQNTFQDASTLGSSNHSDFYNTASLDQENKCIIIPTLSLTEPSQEPTTRKKMPTDRPLKSKNLEAEKFVGNKLVNLKFSKMPQVTNLSDEIAKKFVRKNPLSSSRRTEAQNSERFFDSITNTKN